MTIKIDYEQLEKETSKEFAQEIQNTLSYDIVTFVEINKNDSFLKIRTVHDDYRFRVFIFMFKSKHFTHNTMASHDVEFLLKKVKSNVGVNEGGREICQTIK